MSGEVFDLSFQNWLPSEVKLDPDRTGGLTTNILDGESVSLDRDGRP